MASGFIAGLVKGFGGSYLQSKQQQRLEEHRAEQNQLGMFQDALKTAADRGDTDAVSRILTTIDEFTQNSGKGSKGKKNQQGILTNFASMLKNGQSAEGIPLEQTSQPSEMIEPLEATRPRISNINNNDPRLERKPFFTDPNELRARRIKSELQAKEPFRLKEIQEQGEVRKSIKKEDHQARLREILTQGQLTLEKLGISNEFKLTQKTEERAKQIATAQGREVTDEDREIAGQEFNEKFRNELLNKQKRNELMDSRMEKISSDIDISQQRLQAWIKFKEHQSKVDDEKLKLSQEAGARGERRLNITESKSSLENKAKIQKGKFLSTRLNSIKSQIDTESRIMGNGLTPNKIRGEARQRRDSLDVEYNQIQKEMNDLNIDMELTDRANNASKNIKDAPNKVLNQRINPSQSNPLGLRLP